MKFTPDWRWVATYRTWRAGRQGAPPVRGVGSLPAVRVTAGRSVAHVLSKRGAKVPPGYCAPAAAPLRFRRTTTKPPPTATVTTKNMRNAIAASFDVTGYL